jgi:hypothetical protein
MKSGPIPTCSDPNEIDKVIDMIQNIFDRSLLFGNKLWEKIDPNHSPLLRDHFGLLIRNVSWMINEGLRAGVGHPYGLGRKLDRIFQASAADMGGVNHDVQPIHLLHRTTRLSK